MSKTITFFTTNDIHGHFLGENGAIDFSRLATLKKQNEGSLLIDAGDATQGTPLAIAKKGLYPIQIMNLVGYDILTIGNHEFDNITKDEGIECELDLVVKEFKNTYLSQNLFFNKNGEYVRYISTIKPYDGGIMPLCVNGECILFFGVATPEMSMNIKRMKGFRIDKLDEIVKDLREQIELIKKSHDVKAIVAITHLGGQGNTTSFMLAEMMPEIDLIIDGHSHEEYIKNAETGNTTIVQTGCYGKKFGKIQIIINDDGTKYVEASLYDNTYLNTIEQDKEVRDELDKMEAEVEKEFGKIWANTPNCTLWGGALEETKPYVLDAINVARFAETNLGKLVSTAIAKRAGDEYRDKFGTNQSEFIIGAMNGGGLRESLAFDKKIRNYELFTVLPSPLQSENESGYSLFRITLKDLKAILTNSVSYLSFTPGKQLTYSDGRFLNVAGLEFTIVYDEKSDKISVADDITLNMKTDGSTEPVRFNMKDNSDQEVLFCTCKYIGQGGDGYDVVFDNDKMPPILSNDTAMFSIVGEYILSESEDGVIKVPRTNKDITYSGFDFAKPEAVNILITNKDLSPLGSVNVAVRFNTDNDDDVCRFLMTDDKGYITVTPPDGASVLEILVLEAYNEEKSCENLYCELYFHTYYMNTADTLTACCRTFTEVPDIQRALITFRHTSQATGRSHYSNYVAFNTSSFGYGEFLIYNNEIYLLHYGDKEFHKTDSVKCSDSEPEFTIDMKSCTYETWFGNGVYTSEPLVCRFDSVHQ